MIRMSCSAIAVFLFVLATSAAHASPKPVIMTAFPAETIGTNQAIYDNFNESLTYGEPKQLALIRARMEFLCSAARDEGIQGLPPAKHETLIQIDDYALADGACGDSSLHMVLIERGPETITWLFDSCERRGDGRVTPLREYLSGKDGCWIVDDSVDRMLLVRSGVRPKYCAVHPQSDVLCHAFRYGASDRRFILYNRAWIKMSYRAERGDMAGALTSAATALRYQPLGIHYAEPCIMELRRLQGLPRAGAIAKWKQWRIDNAPAR